MKKNTSNKPAKSNHYISNKELLQELVDFKKTGQASENLGRMLLLLAKRISSLSRFSSYTWKEEMIGDAVLTCLKYGQNFDETMSTNAFAYLTKICYHAFEACIKKWRKHGKIKQICYGNKDRLSYSCYRAVDYTIFKDDDLKEPPVEEKESLIELPVDETELTTLPDELDKEERDQRKPKKNTWIEKEMSWEGTEEFYKDEELDMEE